MPSDLRTAATPYVLLVLTALLWAGNAIAGKLAVGHISPFLLTGLRGELVPTFATHAHLRAISGVADPAERKQIRLAAADSVKRVHLIKAEDKTDWFADSAQGLHEIRGLVEFKTTWHPIGA